eukprot:364595-Chlamydomonas_euryale.AAC.10
MPKVEGSGRSHCEAVRSHEGRPRPAYLPPLRGDVDGSASLPACLVMNRRDWPGSEVRLPPDRLCKPPALPPARPRPELPPATKAADQSSMGCGRWRRPAAPEPRRPGCAG